VAEIEIDRPGRELEPVRVTDSKFGAVALFRGPGRFDPAKSCFGFLRHFDDPTLQIPGWVMRGRELAGDGGLARLGHDCGKSASGRRAIVRQGTGFHATFWSRRSFIPGNCGPFDLVTAGLAVTMAGEAVKATTSPEEDLMTPRISAANKVAALFAAAAIGAAGFAASPAGAQTSPPAQANKQAKRQFDNRGRPYYGPSGPNVVYQQGPRTRVYVTTRSWLDAGTEVLPGDRKFQDYAFPPEIGYPTFARENNNRPIDRQPLNPPSDMGGYPKWIPLPPN
jgi:hypothetical protein